MNNIDNIFENMMEGKLNEMRNNIYEELYGIIGEKVQEKKLEIASTVFGRDE